MHYYWLLFIIISSILSGSEDLSNTSVKLKYADDIFSNIPQTASESVVVHRVFPRSASECLIFAEAESAIWCSSTTQAKFLIAPNLDRKEFPFSSSRDLIAHRSWLSLEILRIAQDGNLGFRPTNSVNNNSAKKVVYPFRFQVIDQENRLFLQQKFATRYDHPMAYHLPVNGKTFFQIWDLLDPVEAIYGIKGKDDVPKLSIQDIQRQMKGSEVFGKSSRHDNNDDSIPGPDRDIGLWIQARIESHKRKTGFVLLVPLDRTEDLDRYNENRGETNVFGYSGILSEHPNCTKDRTKTYIDRSHQLTEGMHCAFLDQDEIADPVCNLLTVIEKKGKIDPESMKNPLSQKPLKPGPTHHFEVPWEQYFNTGQGIRNFWGPIAAYEIPQSKYHFRIWTGNGKKNLSKDGIEIGSGHVVIIGIKFRDLADYSKQPMKIPNIFRLGSREAIRVIQEKGETYLDLQRVSPLPDDMHFEIGFLELDKKSKQLIGNKGPIFTRNSRLGYSEILWRYGFTPEQYNGSLTAYVEVKDSLGLPMKQRSPENAFWTFLSRSYMVQIPAPDSRLGDRIIVDELSEDVRKRLNLSKEEVP